MNQFFEWLTSTEGFVPRTMCGPGWTGELVLVHRWADCVIFACYALLFFALLNSVRSRNPTTTNTGIVIYALFIVSCGVTHLTNQLMFTEPMYRLDAAAKVICAVLSCVAVWWTVKHFIPRQHA